MNQRQWELDLSSGVVAAGLFVVTVINIFMAQNIGWISVGATVFVGVLFIGFLTQIPKYR